MVFWMEFIADKSQIKKKNAGICRNKRNNRGDNLLSLNILEYG